MKKRHKVIVRLIRCVILMLGHDLPDEVKEELKHAFIAANVLEKEEDIPFDREDDLARHSAVNIKFKDIDTTPPVGTGSYVHDGTGPNE